MIYLYQLGDENMKEYIKGDIKFIVTKNDKGLYDYQSQEYSKINNIWVNMGKGFNFTRVAMEGYLDIVIDF